MEPPKETEVRCREAPFTTSHRLSVFQSRLSYGLGTKNSDDDQFCRTIQPFIHGEWSLQTHLFNPREQSSGLEAARFVTAGHVDKTLEIIALRPWKPSSAS